MFFTLSLLFSVGQCQREFDSEAVAGEGRCDRREAHHLRTHEGRASGPADVDEAGAWANGLIAKIEKARGASKKISLLIKSEDLAGSV